MWLTDIIKNGITKPVKKVVLSSALVYGLASGFSSAGCAHQKTVAHNMAYDDKDNIMSLLGANYCAQTDKNGVHQLCLDFTYKPLVRGNSQDSINLEFGAVKIKTESDNEIIGDLEGELDIPSVKVGLETANTKYELLFSPYVSRDILNFSPEEGVRFSKDGQEASEVFNMYLGIGAGVEFDIIINDSKLKIESENLPITIPGFKIQAALFLQLNWKMTAYENWSLNISYKHDTEGKNTGAWGFGYSFK
ncbi:MAG TPA: hypothetical protein VJC39_00585 [Candidatus Nanoarchaeia archaeon]|nr:hypothetical protein [Candidatus Nanoarchaeia archaeon]